MLPALLITFREVIEASLIVATVLGILTKLGQSKSAKTVWIATIAAAILSVALLGLGSLLGVKVQELYTGKTEELVEGLLMLTSAVFVTWAVFWLHKYFGRYKLALLQKVKTTVDSHSRKALFILVFTAVFREGFEIVLFLSTIYLAASPVAVFSGFGVGALAGLLVAASLFTATLKMPVYRAFQASSLLLILFAAGLAGRGIHEFIEAGIISEMTKVTLAFLPAKETVAGDLIKAIFGLSRSMDDIQLWVYTLYIAYMRWYLYTRKAPITV
jgi:high-affinity iron transporter